ncbi:MAG: F-box-like domain-containing protein [Acinetobacter pittii]|nr:F-box-like domain-containing protein [Acinetobacter pittii]
MPSQSKTLLSLPEELLACIFNAVIDERKGRSTLSSAALTCRRLHSAVQPVPYREISILDTDVERLRPRLKCL